jgi:hypothetical protein
VNRVRANDLWIYISIIALESAKIGIDDENLFVSPQRPKEGVRVVLRRRTQGSLSQSPQGNWRWTRKVKAKDVTVALSDRQVELFRRAIDDHRKLGKLIDETRAISQQVLLNV